MGDGFPAQVTFSANTTIALYIKNLTPPGFDGGPSNDTTNMHNEVLKTKSPGTLVEITDGQGVFNYDSGALMDILDLVNVPQTITYHLPDRSKLAIYGYVQKAIPGNYEPNKPPELTATIVHTNQDPATCEEELPVYVAGTGTASSC